MIIIIIKFFLYIILGAGVILLIIGLIEPHILKTEFVSWKNKNTQTGENIRIALISDIHAEYNFIKPAKLCAEIEAARPDLILFAGDWTASYKQKHFIRVQNWLQNICQTAEKIEIPFLAVPGNHDNDQIREIISDSSNICELLINKTTLIFGKDGSKWRLTGLDDLKYGDPFFPEIPSEKNSTFSPVIPEEKHIVIAHNPDTVLLLENKPWQYFLCGHFHGGQIWAPFKLEFKMFRREAMASQGWYRGERDFSGKKGYINRGLGCVLMPIRLFSRPEITIIDISYPKSI